ncbi:hypothetical protein CcaverHIS002_0105630 [Cutaneotrichosporon cavernicola]|nr:hypothetical protein CcaverHIS002_0105630 [Cutaneotrichosporon cavernicola]
MARLKQAEVAQDTLHTGLPAKPKVVQHPPLKPSPASPPRHARNHLRLSRWEAAGPFPAGMREHPLTASPLAAFGRFSDTAAYTDPELAFAHATYGEGDWPSELPTGGRAGWATFDDKDGEVEVAYPDVRWTQLRADHGWAALQYSALLRTRITIPGTGELTRVLVDAAQAVEYAFVGSSDQLLKWYAGDIYGFGETPSGRAGAEGGPSNFARALALPPGEYVLLVRALYECRMFGDPGEKPPTIKIGMRVFLDDTTAPVSPLAPPQTVVPDVMDKWALGRWISVAVRVPPLNASSCSPEEDQVVEVSAEGYGDGFTCISRDNVRIAPGQTRSVPLMMLQAGQSNAREIEIILRLMQGKKEWRVDTRIPLKHVSSREGKPVTMTVPGLLPEIPPVVSTAIVLPPFPYSNTTNAPPVLLALHGAGVPTPSNEWIAAMPRLPGMWAVLPSGRTEWGEDWHGGSLSDAWAARVAFATLISIMGHNLSNDTVLIGHSNGGQGVWHMAARYPDKFRGMIAVAGYTKIQDYVPYTECTSAHYADPALQGILSAALAPYNNDLYLSNLASMPVLAVHGADDDNVPPRHGRAQTAILSAWLDSAAPKDVRFVEVPNVGHVWDGVLRHPAILDFLTNLPPKKTADQVRTAGFTLATANPDETGPKAGIRIAELAVPGRLARLDVNARQWRRPGMPALDLHGTNVRRIDIAGWGNEAKSLVWSKAERAFVDHPPTAPRRYGPMLRLLDSAGPLVLVVGSGPKAARAQCIATRYAHDLRVYHRLDAVLVDEDAALRGVADSSLGWGNVIVLGGPEQNQFAAWMLAQKHVPVSFPTQGVMTVEGRVVWEEGTGIITLLPHPLLRTSLACLVAGNDELGLELAARLLPLRTGVPVPDWAIVSPRMRWQAAGGLVGAGFWGADWGWNESMSWFDRE